MPSRWAAGSAREPSAASAVSEHNRGCPHRTCSRTCATTQSSPLLTPRPGRATGRTRPLSHADRSRRGLQLSRSSEKRVARDAPRAYLRAVHDRSRVAPMPIDDGTFGDWLKTERERRGVTLDEAAAATKINRSLLAALERNDLAQWPKGIFRRAFVREYTKAIGLSPDRAATEFARAFSGRLPFTRRDPAGTRRGRTAADDRSSVPADVREPDRGDLDGGRRFWRRPPHGTCAGLAARRAVLDSHWNHGAALLPRCAGVSRTSASFVGSRAPAINMARTPPGRTDADEPRQSRAAARRVPSARRGCDASTRRHRRLAPAANAHQIARSSEGQYSCVPRG